MSDKLPWYCSIEGCENPKVGNAQYCQTHIKGLQKMQKDIRKAQEKKENQKAIAKMSEKRKDQNSQYTLLRLKFLAKNPACECCGGKADQVHHKKGRTNDLLLEAKYWLAVCGPCHQLITEDSAWAIKEGYSLPRNQ